MHNATPLINTIVGGLVFAFLLGMLANKVKISPVVGYLFAGVLAGPFTPGFVADKNLALELSELGIILLMFGVGLHFSIENLMAVKSIVVPGATLQIAVSIVLGIIQSLFMGWSISVGLLFGLCLSTASTVVLLRTLEELNLLRSKRGQIAVGWLIVEDLIMIVSLVFLPVIVSISRAHLIKFSILLISISCTFGKIIAFILFMMIIGRRIVPWILFKAAATRSRELFTLSVLTLAFGIAFGSVKLFDISFALGAFFAGIVLNESDLSKRIKNDILPLRDAFTVLFFVFIGMLFDPMILISKPLTILCTLSIILIGKSIATLLLVYSFGYSMQTALTIAVSLAQIGEFSFILTGLGITFNIMNDYQCNIILACAILSIMLNPTLFNMLETYLNQNNKNNK